MSMRESLHDEWDLLDEAERTRLLSWGRSEEVFADARPVHELIAACAAATPEATAVVFGEESVSYGELDARANPLPGSARD